MSCFRPLDAYRDRQGAVRLGLGGGAATESFSIPCGRCVGCKMDRARAWSIRITHEAKLYDANRFCTFTYSDEHLPESRSLEYRDFQLFMKRYRKRMRGVSEGPQGGRPLRFFCAGEYGSVRQRPHFHAILFNVKFEDEVEWENGTRWSRLLEEELWQKGSVQLDDVTPASAAYVAGYSMKKVYGRRAVERYEDVVNLATGEVSGRRPEFVAMSLRPGIGRWYFDRYGSDMLGVGKDMAVVDGQRWKVPRYYWERFREEADRGLVEEIEYERFVRAKECRADGTPERRAAREAVAKARVELFRRRKDL